MYSFEGQYRRKPVQSLGGSTKKVQKELLLQKTQEGRLKREQQRNRLNSAVKIQSFYRGCTIRQALKNEQRSVFDSLSQYQKVNILTEQAFSQVLSDLWHKLLFFYHKNTDGNRLNWFCMQCIKHQKTVLRHMIQQQLRGLHRMTRLLVICCRYLEYIAPTDVPFASPLRMLEIFTHHDIYAKSATTKQEADKMVHKILSFLICNGYYKCMRVLVEEKVPDSLEHSARPPTPLADCILNLIMKPFSVIAKTENQQLRKEVMQSLCQELLCPAHTKQMQSFILPALAQHPQVFPFSLLVDALLSQEIQPTNSVCNIKLNIDGSLWLLYTILTLGEKQIANLSQVHLQQYLGLLHHLSVYLVPPRSKYGAILDDDDSDCEEMMEVEEQSPSSSAAEIQRTCIALLDQPSHVQSLLSSIRQHEHPSSVLALCSLCHVLMAKRKLLVHRTRLLYSLAFSPWFLKLLWKTCVSASTTTVTGSQMPLLQLLSSGFGMSPEYQSIIVPLVSVFCSLFSQSLMSLHDAEFYGESKDGVSFMPFQVSRLVPMSQALRDACLGIIELAHPDTRPAQQSNYSAAFHSVGVPQKTYTDHDLHEQRETWAYLFKVISQLVKQLHTRDSRRQFCPQGHWLASRLTIVADRPSQIYNIQSEALQRRPFGSRSALNTKRQMEEDGPPLSTTEVRNITVLTEMPFIVSFEERVKILQKLLNLDHAQHQQNSRLFNVGPMINITARRPYLYEDAFERLSQENEPNMKLKLQVQLKNFQGLDEAGIDGGGIFREFMTELMKTAFDPNRGLFLYTKDQLSYPNPQSRLIVEDFTKHYFFLGRILGKALYENMLVELPFASFFLNKILSHKGQVDIHHLASLDPEMYKNLLFLKNYDGDIADLGLDFTVVNNDLGEAQIVELKSGGRDILVTVHNRIEYIHLMADYRLNRQIHKHCSAFRQGLSDVINIDWLRMFDHNELQVLISGASVPIDIGDLRRHTNYSGGYAEDHPVMLTFWKVVESFTDSQKCHLLKFVTSCSRPPLLGFKDLYPAFCIQLGGNDSDRLPSASTCMNLLKLPEFKDEETMRTKLLYAVESGAGFELS